MLNFYELLGCMLATIFFAMLLDQPWDTLIYTAIISVLGYITYLLLGQGVPAFFISGLLVGFLCEIIARLKKKTTTLFLISGIIPLVPGLGLYRSAILLAEKDYYGALQAAVEALGGIGAIALAITLSTMLFSNIRFHRKPTQKGELNAPSDHQ